MVTIVTFEKNEQTWDVRVRLPGETSSYIGKVNRSLSGEMSWSPDKTNFDRFRLDLLREIVQFMDEMAKDKP
jgi:hypothetical protein